MRLALAIGMVTLALAAALYLHQRTHLESCGFRGFGGDRPQCSVHSSWQAPVAVLIAVAGIALAGIVTRTCFVKPEA